MKNCTLEAVLNVTNVNDTPMWNQGNQSYTVKNVCLMYVMSVVMNIVLKVVTNGDLDLIVIIYIDKIKSYET